MLGDFGFSLHFWSFLTWVSQIWSGSRSKSCPTLTSSHHYIFGHSCRSIARVYIFEKCSVRSLQKTPLYGVNDHSGKSCGGTKLSEFEKNQKSKKCIRNHHQLRTLLNSRQESVKACDMIPLILSNSGFESFRKEILRALRNGTYS